eukprot:GFUD01057376.1.p1 GENE.GFUD01057376.1~~GFUD01057376.1.p1  ORF type:complete len:227 (+),score=73.53 GFUD01057376.1:1466-2146(+)
MDRNNLRTIVLELLDSRTVTSLRKQLRLSEQISFHPRLGKVIRFGCQVCKLVLLGYCVGNTTINLVGYPASVNGKSMQPTLNPVPSQSPGWLDMDWVWVSCWRARRYNFVRGDLVVYNSPKDPYEYLIKRLIAAEGDTIKTGGRYSQPAVRIPQGHIWVEGDNWNNSVDSNKYGPVPKGLVSGVATHIIWPPSRMQMLVSTVPARLQPHRVTRGEVGTEWSNSCVS